jgi:hypothetical protein
MLASHFDHLQRPTDGCLVGLVESNRVVGSVLERLIRNVAGVEVRRFGGLDAGAVGCDADVWMLSLGSHADVASGLGQLRVLASASLADSPVMVYSGRAQMPPVWRREAIHMGATAVLSGPECLADMARWVRTAVRIKGFRSAGALRRPRLTPSPQEFTPLRLPVRKPAAATDPSDVAALEVARRALQAVLADQCGPGAATDLWPMTAKVMARRLGCSGNAAEVVSLLVKTRQLGEFAAVNEHHGAPVAEHPLVVRRGGLRCWLETLRQVHPDLPGWTLTLAQALPSLEEVPDGLSAASKFADAALPVRVAAVACVWARLWPDWYRTEFIPPHRRGLARWLARQWLLPHEAELVSRVAPVAIPGLGAR